MKAGQQHHAMPGLRMRLVADGSVIYDPSAGTATALDQLSTKLFLACGDGNGLAPLRAASGDEAVDAALEQMRDAGLLGHPLMGRRNALRLATIAGVSALAAPAVVSLALPAAAAAASAPTKSGGETGSSGGSTTGDLGPADGTPPAGATTSTTVTSAIGNEQPGTVKVVTPGDPAAGSGTSVLASSTARKANGKTAKQGSSTAVGSAKASATTTRPLAFTGADTLRMAEVGVALIGAGTLAIGAAKLAGDKDS